MTQEYVEALRQVPAGHWELVLASTRQYTPWKRDAVELKEKKPAARARVPAGESVSCYLYTLPYHAALPRTIDGL